MGREQPSLQSNSREEHTQRKRVLPAMGCQKLRTFETLSVKVVHYRTKRIAVVTPSVSVPATYRFHV